MKGIPINLVGKKFGSLTVISLLEKTLSGSRWECECDCGGLAIKMTSTLRSIELHPEVHKSMGCDECEISRRSLSRTRHGWAKSNTDGKSRLWGIWKGMKSRCKNPVKYYGERGISVCSGWMSFISFRDWALSHGYADNLTIERMDPDGNYEPTNCEWITRSENSRRARVNRRGA